MLKLSSNVSDVFPKVLKLSCEVSECKPLHVGDDDTGSNSGGGGGVLSAAAPRAHAARHPAGHRRAGFGT